MIEIIIPIAFDVNISYVQTTIKSILNQTYKNIHIVVGLNSTINIKKDDIKNIDTNCDVYIFDNITTKYDMLNNIIPFIKKEWVCFAEPGDEWYNNKIEIQIQYIDRYDIIGCSCRFTGLKNGMACLLYGKVKECHFINGRPIIDNTVIMKRELCKWQTKYGIHADYKMFYKLHTKKYTCYNIPEVLLSCRIFHNNNNNKLDIDIFEKIAKKINKKITTNKIKNSTFPNYNYIM